MQKTITSLIILFVLSSILLPANFVMAQDEYSDIIPTSACPKCDQSIFNKDKDYIRLQVEIPGITKKCSYKVQVLKEGEVKSDNKNCYYIEANLPQYIKSIYNFSIGAIAILAVLIILSAGFQWIFAAGNPAKIGAAKKRIQSAVTGLILILSSYVLLSLINPNLVRLQDINPPDVATIEQVTNQCIDKSNSSNIVVLKKVENNEPVGSDIALASTPELSRKISDLTCGDNFVIKSINGKTDAQYTKFNNNKIGIDQIATCKGDYCDHDHPCVQVSFDGKRKCLEGYNASYWGGDLTWEKNSWLKETKLAVICSNGDIKDLYGGKYKRGENVFYYSDIGEINAGGSGADAQKIKTSIIGNCQAKGFVLKVKVQRNMAIDDWYAIDKNCNPIAGIKNSGETTYKPGDIDWSVVDTSRFAQLYNIQSTSSYKFTPHTCDLHIDSAFKSY